MSKLDRTGAGGILQRCGVGVSEDFHRLDSGRVESLLDEADAYGYRKPKNANGSRARYFCAFAQRVAQRDS